LSTERTLRQEVRLDGDFDLAGDGAVHSVDLPNPGDHHIEKSGWNQPELPRPAAIPIAVSTKFRPKAHAARPIALHIYLASPVPKMPSDTIFRIGWLGKVHPETVPDDLDCRSNCRTRARPRRRRGRA
jgi:hypothetical protein